MNLFENEIRKIINAYEGISYIDVEDSGEGSLFDTSVDYIDTLKLTDHEYNSWEDLLDSIDINKDTYQIYCSWDRSGYKYWTQDMEESNYTYIEIWISDDFSDNDFKSLIKELDEIVRQIDDFWFNCQWNKNN